MIGDNELDHTITYILICTEVYICKKGKAQPPRDGDVEKQKRRM